MYMYMYCIYNTYKINTLSIFRIHYYMYIVIIIQIIYVYNQCFPQGLGCGLGVVNVHINAFHANLNTHQRIKINLSRVAHPATCKRLWGNHCV